VGETILPGRVVLAVTGTDRARFLDGLLTCNVGERAPGAVVYGALLTPQGKVVTDLFAFVEEDRTLLDVPEAAADDLLRRLGIYRLRAAVGLERTDARVAVGAGADDPRAGGLGGRRVVDGGVEDAAALADYRRRRIAAVVPDAAADFPLGDTFPHDANMDLTGGVDFTKGCFVGQEVVSRMRHRGTARRRTVAVHADAPLPPSGTALTVGGREIGTLGTVEGTEGLAVVRIDRTRGEAEAGGVPLRLTPPPGAPFRLALDEAAS
jgi:folate-binding protein YgfZ